MVQWNIMMSLTEILDLCGLQGPTLLQRLSPDVSITFHIWLRCPERALLSANTAVTSVFAEILLVLFHAPVFSDNLI